MQHTECLNRVRKAWQLLESTVISRIRPGHRNLITRLVERLWEKPEIIQVRTEPLFNCVPYLYCLPDVYVISIIDPCYIVVASVFCFPSAIDVLKSTYNARNEEVNLFRNEEVNLFINEGKNTKKLLLYLVEW